MEYFGTDLRQAGHYRWILSESGMRENGLRCNDLPFNPEELTNNLQKGETAFYQGGGFTVIAIAGSPIDKRPGTKSVFWLKETLSKEEMIQRIKSNQAANSIIEAMPFDVLF